MAKSSSDPISVDDLLAAITGVAPKTSQSEKARGEGGSVEGREAPPKEARKSASSQSAYKPDKNDPKRATKKNSSKKGSKKKKQPKPLARDVEERDLLAALGIDLDEGVSEDAQALKRDVRTGEADRRETQPQRKAGSPQWNKVEKRSFSKSPIKTLQSGIEDIDSVKSPGKGKSSGITKKTGFSTLRFDSRVQGVMSESHLEPQHYPGANIGGRIAERSIERRGGFSVFAPSAASLQIKRLSDADRIDQGINGGDTAVQPLEEAIRESVPQDAQGYTASQPVAEALQQQPSFEEGSPGEAYGSMPGAQVQAAQSVPIAPSSASPSMQMPPAMQPAQLPNAQTTPQPGVPYAPQQDASQGFLTQPSYAARQQIENIKQDQKRSKPTIVLGVILIVLAVVCAVFAIGILSGLFNLHPQASAPANGGGNSQSSPLASISNPNNEEAAQQDADAESSADPALTAQYSYVIRGLDGTAHEAIETAEFNAAGILEQSTIQIEVSNQETADVLLEQLKDEFGDSIKDSQANENSIVIVLDINRDDLTKEAYSELLAANMVEFRQIS